MANVTLIDAIAAARTLLDAESRRAFAKPLDTEQVEALSDPEQAFAMLDDMEARMGLDVGDARALLAEAHTVAPPATGPLQAACPTCGGTRILRLVRTTVGTEISHFVRTAAGELVAGGMTANEVIDYENADEADHAFECVSCGQSLEADDLVVLATAEAVPNQGG